MGGAGGPGEHPGSRWGLRRPERGVLSPPRGLWSLLLPLTLLSICTRSLSSIFCQSCSCPLILATSSCIMWFSCSVVASNWTRLTLPARALLSAFCPEREDEAPGWESARWMEGPHSLRCQPFSLNLPRPLGLPSPAALSGCGPGLTTSISISRCSRLAFSFSSFSSPWYNSWEAEGAEDEEQGPGAVPRPPRRPAPPHINVLLLLPMILDEAAGGDVELLAVALHLQDSALDVAQQLFVLRQKDKVRLLQTPLGVLPSLEAGS